MKVTWTNTGNLSVKGITTESVYEPLFKMVWQYVADNKSAKRSRFETTGDYIQKVDYAISIDIFKKLQTKVTHTVTALSFSPSEALFLFKNLESTVAPSLQELRLSIHKAIISWK
jgi:hypothetical protein